MSPNSTEDAPKHSGDPADSTDGMANAASSAVGTKAEGTNYRTGPLPLGSPAATRRSADGYAWAGKSIRLHARPARVGLATKIAVPIILGMLAGFIAVSFVIRDRVFDIQLRDLQNDAANAAFTASIFGRVIISRRADFLRENPGYQYRAEWNTGRHWLHAGGFVSSSDWVEAAGFHLNELAPVEALERAAEKTILAPLDNWMNDPESDADLAAVHIIAGNDTVLASAVSPGFVGTPTLLRSLPPPGDAREVGGTRVTVDYLPDLEPEPVVRAVAQILPEDGADPPLGMAVVVMRTQGRVRQQSAILYLLLGLAVLLTALMSVVCWYSARRVTRIIRRIAVDMQAIAEGDFARRAPVMELDEMGQLGTAFNSMAERLRVARANEQEASRLESDLSIARSIQNNLLPPQTPRVRGLDIHTSYRPAKEIGGDYFDFLPVDGEHMGVVIADASGKSIPAALVMSTTRAILRFVAPGKNSAAETLTSVNSILSVDIPKGMFVTAYYVILDPLGETMSCASAGHTPLLIARVDGSVDIMNPGGIALGFDNGPIFERSIREQKMKLSSGDRVLLYTDGVVECVNTANEEYSDRRLREFLRRNRELPSRDFVGALTADLDRHRGAAEMRDDTTIVTFRVL